MELLKIVSQIGKNNIFSFFLIFLKIDIPLISLGRKKHITNWESEKKILTSSLNLTFLYSFYVLSVLKSISTYILAPFHNYNGFRMRVNSHFLKLPSSNNIFSKFSSESNNYGTKIKGERLLFPYQLKSKNLNFSEKIRLWANKAWKEPQSLRVWRWKYSYL